MIGQRIFFPIIIFVQQKFVFPKKIVKKSYRQFFGPKKIFGLKKIGQKIWEKNCLVHKNFGQKIFGKKNLEKKI